MINRLLVLLCVTSFAALAADGYPRSYPPESKPYRFEAKKPEPKKEAPKPKEAVKPREVVKAAEPAPAAGPAKAEEHGQGPELSGIVKDLVSGNDRFEHGYIRMRDVLGARSVLAKGQHPNTIVLGCSDSRVPPEVLFDESIGDLFVIRSAGNVADKIGLGSIEYAAEHLHASVLVVLGHEKCGAVTAAASGAKMPTENLQALVDEISPGIASLKTKFQGDELVHHGVEANVNAVAYEVVERSPIIRHLVEEGKLTILRAVYDLESGHVRWVGGDQDQVTELCTEPHVHEKTALAP